MVLPYMPRKPKRDPYVCPYCGVRAENPERTWQLVAPFPDAYERITITIMGSFRCSSCGATWRTVVSKVKVGGEGVEVEGAKGVRKLASGKPRREGEIIEVDIDEE